MFKASAGQVDLSPPVGGWMTGFAARVFPTAGIHDPIMARAMLLDDGRAKLAIVVCDIIGLTPAAVADIRHRIARKSVIPSTNVLISCTHTHSGPASMPFRGVMGHVDAAWLAEAQRKIVELVVALPGALAPAQFAVASASVSEIGYNRQDHSRPVDETLTTLTVEDSDGVPIATLVNYGTHPVVLGPDNLLFSADYPGEVARALEQQRGGLGLFLQGTCGDVDPVVYRDRGWGTGTFDDTRAMGQCLAAAAVAALREAPRTDEITLNVTSKLLEIPLDQPLAPEALAALIAGFEAERQQAVAVSNVMQEQVALAMLEWAHELEGALAGGTLQRTLPSELFVAAINGVRIIGLPFETYTDIGLAVKCGLQPLRVLFAGYANGLYGYCPTAWAKDQGGYGPDSSCRWFPRLLTAVGYGADDLIAQESINLAK
ncbi:MAG: neutral/alkaline non-lysosomal ceramidase N-terminal domain-containing protein [Chloroflexi bacterium]|nr:neutral/alkaline non-lysosomal ceramidase N-terminal domain-containing protein [Chloroflexota bacterium]